MSDTNQAEDSREIAIPEGKSTSLGVQLKDREPNFAAALPAHIPAERFMRVVLTAVQNNPDLARADRASLWNACMRAAQDGLLPDGRDGALVIYRSKSGEKDEKGRDVWIDKVQWMPMIGGLRKKVRNSGEIKDWSAHVVHAKDHFEFELGDSPFIKHKPFMDGDPGQVIAAYSVAQFKTGELSREVMTRAEIEKVRSVSRSKDKGPWLDWYEEMCRKVVARRHSKILPMSSDLDDLIRRDDELYDLDGKSDKAADKASPKSLADKLDALAGISAQSDPKPRSDEDDLKAKAEDTVAGLSALVALASEITDVDGEVLKSKGAISPKQGTSGNPCYFDGIDIDAIGAELAKMPGERSASDVIKVFNRLKERAREREKTKREATEDTQTTARTSAEDLERAAIASADRSSGSVASVEVIDTLQGHISEEVSKEGATTAPEDSARAGAGSKDEAAPSAPIFERSGARLSPSRNKNPLPWKHAPRLSINNQPINNQPIKTRPNLC